MSQQSFYIYEITNTATLKIKKCKLELYNKRAPINSKESGSAWENSTIHPVSPPQCFARHLMAS